MELERGLMDNLINYLKNHGYPDDCFFVEYNMARDCYVDLAIVDKASNIPIMLFEIKNTKNEQTKLMAIRQLKRCQSYLDDKDTPFYVVYPKDTVPGFEAIRINPTVHVDAHDLNNQVKEDIIFGKYSYNINTRVSRVRGNKIKKKRKMVGAFRWICWSIAILLIFIGLLMATGKIFITTNALYVFALAIVLIICPFVSSIKILGIEIKQLEDQTQK